MKVDTIRLKFLFYSKLKSSEQRKRKEKFAKK